MLAVLGWRYWAGRRPDRVKAVTKKGVEAVTIGSNYWVGCGGLYKLSEVSKAYADGACIGRAYIGGARVDGGCADKACTDKACISRTCTDRAFADEAYADGGYGGGTCTDKAVIPFG